MTRFVTGPIAVAASILLGAGVAGAQELNIYSSRHYQTDERLYDDFTKATGITVNRIEEDGDKLITRIQSEGRNSPADLFITVDAGRLWRAEEKGLFQPVRSELLEQRIPAHLRHPKGEWFGFSKRARVILYNKDLVQEPPQSYEALADPRYKDMICIRSSSNVYNLSLMAAMIARHGEKKAEDWARGVVANMARPPKGGDTDQIKAAAAGECGIAVANTYYFVRFVKSDKPEERAAAGKLGVVFPDSAHGGTHVNISGAGVLKYAPHKEAAVKFLEYLASDAAQRYFALGNNEYPVVEGVAPDPALAALGRLDEEKVNVSVYGENQPEAQRLFDKAGWK